MSLPVCSAVYSLQLPSSDDSLPASWRGCVSFAVSVLSGHRRQVGHDRLPWKEASAPPRE